MEFGFLFLLLLAFLLEIPFAASEQFALRSQPKRSLLSRSLFNDVDLFSPTNSEEFYVARGIYPL